jgi:hypothetical protein
VEENLIRTTLRAGVYGGSSTIAGPLIGQAGYVIPPNLQYIEDGLTRIGSAGSTNNPGLVYVEFTYAL